MKREATVARTSKWTESWCPAFTSTKSAAQHANSPWHRGAKGVRPTLMRAIEIRLEWTGVFLCSVRAAEGSALRALKEKLFSHRSELMLGFQQYDQNNTGALQLLTGTFSIIFLCTRGQTFSLHRRHGVGQWVGSGSGGCSETGPSLEDTAAAPCPSRPRRPSQVSVLFWRHGTGDPSGSGLS